MYLCKLLSEDNIKTYFRNMKLNAISFFYLFLRVFPFIIASYFTLTSLFNQDFKGIIYLAGLLFTCFIIFFIGNILPKSIDVFQNTNINRELCNALSFNNTSPITNLPLGQAVLGYTFMYLLYSMIKYDYIKQNINTIIFFSFIIITDIVWNAKNSCYKMWQLGASLLISSIFGLLWGYIINSMNNKNLVFITGINNKQVCRKPATSTFKCKTGKKLDPDR